MTLHNFMEFLSEHLMASPQVMGASESAARGQPATVEVHLASGHSWELTVAYKGGRGDDRRRECASR